jgi:hypothetical protein
MIDVMCRSGHQLWLALAAPAAAAASAEQRRFGLRTPTWALIGSYVPGCLLRPT